jgi:hypothetical protein
MDFWGMLLDCMARTWFGFRFRDLRKIRRTAARIRITPAIAPVCKLEYTSHEGPEKR